MADLGDVLTATPALRALRQAWPEVTVDVLTTPIGAEALSGLDSVDRLWQADKHRFDSPLGSPLNMAPLLPLLRQLRAEHYDQLLLFHHLTTAFGTAKYALLTRLIGARRTVGLDNGRGRFLDLRVRDDGFGARHEVDYCLDLAAAAGALGTPPPHLEIALDDASRQKAAQLLSEFPLPPERERARVREPGASDTQWIALHVGGGTYSLARRWAPEPFAEVGRNLRKRTGAKLVLLGTDVDAQATANVEQILGADVVNLAGHTSLKQTAAVLDRCQLLVSNDSGVIHVAAAVGTPVVAVFGPSNDAAWGPYPPEEHRVVRATLPCSPCFYRGKSLGTPQGCPTRDCLQLVTPAMVVAAAEELLCIPAAVAPL